MATKTVTKVTQPKSTAINVKPNPVKYTSLNDIQKQYGLDYSQKFAKQQADAQAQAKLTGLNNQGKEIDTGITNAQDAMGRDYFQKGLQLSQAQVNGGVNAGLAAEGNLRLGMSKQADMSKMYREAQTEKNKLAALKTNVETERKAQEAQIFKDGQERAFDKARWQTEFNNSNSKWQTEFANNQAINNRNFNYQQGRDTIGDKKYADQFKYQQQRDTVGDKKYFDQFKYQQQRDKVGDNRWQDQFNAGRSDASADRQWREYTYNNMSKAQKTQFEWAKQQFGEEKAWQQYQMEYNGNIAMAQSQAEMDYYGSQSANSYLNFLQPPGRG